MRDSDARREQLENFREKVRKAKHVKFWKSPDELAGQVALTYNKFVRQHPATGWIRANQAASTESLKELIAANSRNQQLEEALKIAQTSAPAGTEDLAQGDDKFRVLYYVSASYKKPSGITGKANVWTNQSTTWDTLFAAIAPQLLQEAEETALQKGVEKFIQLEFLDESVDVAVKAAKKSDSTIKASEINR